jgi:hypothetical protein
VDIAADRKIQRRPSVTVAAASAIEVTALCNILSCRPESGDQRPLCDLLNIIQDAMQ